MNIGIYGYGNLGRAVEICAEELGHSVVGIFTRRDTGELRSLRAPVYKRGEAEHFVGKIDCMLMCGGSRGDLRADTPSMSRLFNTVDSFDIHSEIPEHLERVGAAARDSRHTSVVSAGWDPGVLSLFRLLFKSYMPRAALNTFWGRGVSQGHSEAIRRIEGVKRAVEYTVPRADSVALARSGVSLSDRERHLRECYVVASPDREMEIEEKIKSMPHYFEGYETTVHFISEEEFMREHIGFSHRGECVAFSMSGKYKEHRTRATLSLELDSNPEFTAAVMLAYASACTTLNKEGKIGALTVFDIAPSYLFMGEKYKLL